MYKRTGIFAGLFAASALLATSAFAQEIQAEFGQLDRDEDGVISQQEAQGTPLGQNYQQADADQDSNVSEEEFNLYKEQLEIQQSGGGQSGGGGGQGG